jgi:cysteine desulfuration protein SufE
VWLVTRRVGDRLEFDAISDSAIVSGLIAILRRVYNGRRAADIVASRPDFIAGLGLDQHLSPTRSNGLHAMISALRHAAAAAAAA